jgi:hypothetical protein
VQNSNITLYYRTKANNGPYAVVDDDELVIFIIIQHYPDSPRLRLELPPLARFLRTQGVRNSSLIQVVNVHVRPGIIVVGSDECFQV